jgi:adenylate cyclase
MSSQTAALPPRLSKTKVTLMLTDVTRMLSIASELDGEEAIAVFLDGYYELCSSAVVSAGGEVIKYAGDACLASFGEDEVEAAVACLVDIRDRFSTFCKSQGVTPTGVKGAIHVGEVIAGEFGPEGQRDIIGKTANTLFSMEAPGLTLSEQAYRKLPSDKRGPWQKRGGHVVYVMK